LDLGIGLRRVQGLGWRFVLAQTIGRLRNNRRLGKFHPDRAIGVPDGRVAGRTRNIGFQLSAFFSSFSDLLSALADLLAFLLV
jgi:hypothetical protein